MKILLVSATQQEISGLQNGIKNYSNLTIDILVTGVGMVATAFRTGIALQKKYDLAINLGIAGSFSRNLSIGDVVNVYADRFSELGAEDDLDFLTLEDMKLEGTTEIINDVSYGFDILDSVPKVTGITVNRVHGNEKSIETVFERHHPFMESMEGAAFLYACVESGIPCIQLRAVSNYVEKRNRNAWNIPLAIKNLNQKTLEILDALNSRNS